MSKPLLIYIVHMDKQNTPGIKNLNGASLCQAALTVSIGDLLFVFASAFSIMLAGSFTVTKFTDSDLRMGGPPVKVLVCRR